MDAVTGADKARFERHLASCQACARELAELGEATAHWLPPPPPSRPAA